SDWALRRELIRAERYYLGRDQAAFSEGIHNRVVDALNWACGILFAIGVSLTIAFATVNLNGDQGVTHPSEVGPSGLAYDGQSVPNMQAVPSTETRGQSLTPMQQLPQTTPSSTSTQGGGAHTSPTTAPPATAPTAAPSNSK